MRITVLDENHHFKQVNKMVVGNSGKFCRTIVLLHTPFERKFIADQPKALVGISTNTQREDSTRVYAPFVICPALTKVED
jgi:hypothetical protein